MSSAPSANVGHLIVDHLSIELDENRESSGL